MPYITVVSIAGRVLDFQHIRDDVILFQVMDPSELEFPFKEATLFRGLEQYPELLTDPRSLRDGYLEEVNRFVAALQRGCLMQNIDYVQLRTDHSLGVALSGYLAIEVLLRFVRTRSYFPFVAYRLAFGAGVLALVLARG